ncbi:uncharacterized protein LOC114353157 [Ostrinia furnacalis]|uniref:uncharacterized protein LOC114353157 n=1 Tax=Ostrinia furnacalis TaxID=93504 RepID=UPI00103BA821|nr:uncharacterized protein LOC114353157 [Ostrinia furnacalis]
MDQTLEPRLPTDLEVGAGRLVIQFLQENKDGATASDIIKHVREDLSNDTKDLDKLVEAILENGTALGFLERKGSHYMNWMARDTCGKRRRSCSRRRRRRKIRRRSCRRRSRKC